jgi:tRNA(fMet)-specific endonuclease VapC
VNLWILDTDHTSLFLEGNPLVVDKIAQRYSDLAISVITVQELFNGWVVRINNPAYASNLVWLYTKLWQTTEFTRNIRVLNFDEAADTCYKKLLRDYKQLDKKRLHKDMRIAAIAMSLDATLVTRNYRDFSQVPNLKIENWVTDM